MSLKARSFEFDEFLLNTEDKILLRRGEPVSMTPKTFQLLLALVKNHGRIVEKEELMKAVWADSFVEDGNLTFTMRLLRKALGDEKQNPRFIKTVPRRGYRFIAEVRETIKDDNAAPETFSQTTERDFERQTFYRKYLISAVGVLLVAAISTGFWYARSKSLEAGAPVLSAPFSSEKLSTNGKVLHAVISPDGKNVVYTNSFGGKQSIWLRQLESANNVEIIPPSEDNYFGLALSPDGNFLYFSRQERGYDGQANIYRLSIFGGVPTKVVGEAQGWISLSPDGEKISFVRCYYREEENCSLSIADATDGKNERKLVSRPRPFRIGENKISPDGRSIAFAFGQSENSANEFGLAEVDIESGMERELTSEKFFNIKHLAWLPDRSGLLLTARRNNERNFRIRQVFSPSGEVLPLTKDSESYSALSLDRNASAIVATQVKREVRLILFQMDNPSISRVLADVVAFAFAPNGNIIFSSDMSGNDEIWSVNADGSARRQLTNDSFIETSPVISPDNNLIFFASTRTGEVHVWRMNADGSNQTQITQKEGGFPIFASPDSQWLYYHHGRQRTLWRVSTNGGEEQLVLNKEKYRFAVSPDGLQAAFSERQGEERVLTIVSLADGQIFKTFHLADGKARLLEIVWSSDGNNLAYISADSEHHNNSLWLQPFVKDTPQKLADLGDERIEDFEFSPDGKSFAIAQGGWKHDAVLLKGLK